MSEKMKSYTIRAAVSTDDYGRAKQLFYTIVNNLFGDVVNLLLGSTDGIFDISFEIRTKGNEDVLRYISSQVAECKVWEFIVESGYECESVKDSHDDATEDMTKQGNEATDNGGENSTIDGTEGFPDDGKSIEKIKKALGIDDVKNEDGMRFLRTLELIQANKSSWDIEKKANVLYRVIYDWAFTNTLVFFDDSNPMEARYLAYALKHAEIKDGEYHLCNDCFATEELTGFGRDNKILEILIKVKERVKSFMNECFGKPMRLHQFIMAIKPIICDENE